MDNPQPTTIPAYDEAVRWIYDRIDYERVRPRPTSAHFRLERIERLLALIGSPQQRIPAVHIAGTKGKGSTAAMLDAILTASGMTSGLYTSPHIHKFEERMRVGGRMPSPDELTSLVAELQDRLADAPADLAAEGVTYFEVATLLAWMFFDRLRAEIVVLETGLGGRLDCTNVCCPLLTIITNIGLDHTHILGNTIDKIAAEKAGIIKEGVPVLTWASQEEAAEVIAETAFRLGCDLLTGDREMSVHIESGSGSLPQRLTISTPVRNHLDVRVNLAGDHQARNAALAITAADLLSRSWPRITAPSIAEGIAATHWPLRFEIISETPPIVLDAAHNPDSIAALANTFRQRFGHVRPRVLVFGSSTDKDAARMLALLWPEFDAVVVTEFQTNPRATSRQKLLLLAQEKMSADGADAASTSLCDAATPREALAEARSLAGHDGVICVAGSIFLSAEVRELLVDQDIR